MKQNMNKQTTCCFTGPRPHKLPFLKDKYNARRAALGRAIEGAVIEAAVRHHCTTFLCGMAQGADMLFAEIVLQLKGLCAECIGLVCVLPYLAQAEKWPKEAQEEYKSILARADRSILLQREYTDGCLLKRNRFLVDHSSCLIAVAGSQLSGGTGYTVEYARSHNLNISLIDPQNI